MTASLYSVPTISLASPCFWALPWNLVFDSAQRNSRDISAPRSRAA
jgi:hypothetical protein